MQNMHLQPQKYPTRIIWFWKEAVLPAGSTFQAPQSRFSPCLLQSNLCATDWLCVCCYSSWSIWLMTLLGGMYHEPSTNTPSLLLEKVPFLALLKKMILREWLSSEILGDKDWPWPQSPLNGLQKHSEEEGRILHAFKANLQQPSEIQGCAKKPWHCSSMSCNTKHRETSWGQLWRLQRLYLAQTGINAELKHTHRPTEVQMFSVSLRFDKSV